MSSPVRGVQGYLASHPVLCAWGTLILTVIVAWGGTIAHAAAPDADDLIRQGVELRRKGNDEAALQRFESAFQIDPTPRAVAQMGLAEQALGRWVKAHEHLRRALESGSDPWIRKSHQTLEEAVAYVSEHVGQLQILGGSPGAEVRINGVAQGSLPLKQPITVATGSVTIDLAAPGLASIQRITIVRARETVRESFGVLPPLALQAGSTHAGANGPRNESGPLGSSKTADTSSEDSAGSGSTESETDGATVKSNGRHQKDATPPESAPQDSGARPVLKWVAWGAGALALGVGTYGWVRQNKSADDFATGCGVSAGQIVMKPGSTRSVAECKGLQSTVDSNYHIEIIGLVAAGVLAATGLVLWLTEPSQEATAATTAVSCGGDLLSTRRTELTCQLRWTF